MFDLNFFILVKPLYSGRNIFLVVVSLFKRQWNNGILVISRNIREQSMCRSFSLFFSFLCGLLSLFCPYTWELYLKLKIHNLCLIKPTEENIGGETYFLIALFKFQCHLYPNTASMFITFTSLEGVTSALECEEGRWRCLHKSNKIKMVSYFLVIGNHLNSDKAAWAIRKWKKAPYY